LKPAATKYSGILPGLYVGSRKARLCPELMKTLSHVLSVHTKLKREKSKHITWKGIDLVDQWDTPISDYFDETYDFIDSTRKGILVHCIAGYSRSTTVVIAYLMRKFNVTFYEAYHYVRVHRSVTRPNPGFIEQLRKYEQELMLRSR
jgi:protein-tyrosine phosphatase